MQHQNYSTTPPNSTHANGEPAAISGTATTQNGFPLVFGLPPEPFGSLQPTDRAAAHVSVVARFAHAPQGNGGRA